MKEDLSESTCDDSPEDLMQSDAEAKSARDCDGYSKQPQAGTESNKWEAEAVWPED